MWAFIINFETVQETIQNNGSIRWVIACQFSFKCINIYGWRGNWIKWQVNCNVLFEGHVWTPPGRTFLAPQKAPRSGCAWGWTWLFCENWPRWTLLAHAHLPCVEEEQIEQMCQNRHTNHLQVPRQAGVFWVTVVWGGGGGTDFALILLKTSTLTTNQNWSQPRTAHAMLCAREIAHHMT